MHERKQTLRPQRRVKRSVNAAHPRTAVPRTRKPVTAELLNEMTHRLVEEFHPEQVILFGSYAWGTPNKDSDVDLMVIVSESTETDYARMVRAYDALIGLRVPKDIFVKTRTEFERYRAVRASLQSRIAEKGKVLYDHAKEPSHAEMVHHR
ncbi:MAG: nucleotidyltransferase domain-containing protein [Chloroflexi bacterium]|nr:nucleotidyltransferase domain-containing protein [Chloroflexota bacterium]